MPRPPKNKNKIINYDYEIERVTKSINHHQEELNKLTSELNRLNEEKRLETANKIYKLMEEKGVTYNQLEELIYNNNK